MKRISLALLLVLLVFVIQARPQEASAFTTTQEAFTLTNPESRGQPDRTHWEIARFTLRWQPAVDRYEVEVILQDNNGESLRCAYGGAAASNAHSDIVALNTANLSAGNSLKRRLLTRLQAVGGPVDDAGADTPCFSVAGAVTVR